MRGLRVHFSSDTFLIVELDSSKILINASVLLRFRKDMCDVRDLIFQYLVEVKKYCSIYFEIMTTSAFLQ